MKYLLINLRPRLKISSYSAEVFIRCGLANIVLAESPYTLLFICADFVGNGEAVSFLGALGFKNSSACLGSHAGHKAVRADAFSFVWLVSSLGCHKLLTNGDNCSIEKLFLPVHFRAFCHVSPDSYDKY